MEGEQEEAGALDSQEQTSEAQPHTSTDSSLTFRLLNTLYVLSLLCPLIMLNPVVQLKFDFVLIY